MGYCQSEVFFGGGRSTWEFVISNKLNVKNSITTQYIDMGKI